MSVRVSALPPLAGRRGSPSARLLVCHQAGERVAAACVWRSAPGLELPAKSPGKRKTYSRAAGAPRAAVNAFKG